MDTKNPNTIAMIEFLRHLTSDGLLTSDEVWDLADFLNNNPAHRKVWPGNILFPLLVSCYEDQLLSSGELAFMAAQISQIERQWSDRLQLLSAHQRAIAWKRIFGPPESDPVISVSVSNGELSLPRVSQVLQVESSRGGDHYDVDLSAHSCTCPDWLDKRQEYPVGHLNRLCKHIAAGFAHTKAANGWLLALVNECMRRNRGVYPANEWAIFQVGSKRKDVLIGCGDTEWVNVYYDGERYGYNLNEDRWAYGDQPPYAKQIIQKMSKTGI